MGGLRRETILETILQEAEEDCEGTPIWQQLHQWWHGALAAWEEGIHWIMFSNIGLGKDILVWCFVRNLQNEIFTGGTPVLFLFPGYILRHNPTSLPSGRPNWNLRIQGMFWKRASYEFFAIFFLQSGIISGWGYTEVTKILKPRPLTSDVLREAEIYILPQANIVGYDQQIWKCTTKQIFILHRQI